MLPRLCDSGEVGVISPRATGTDARVDADGQAVGLPGLSWLAQTGGLKHLNSGERARSARLVRAAR